MVLDHQKKLGSIQAVNFTKYVILTEVHSCGKIEIWKYQRESATLQKQT